MRCVCGGGDLAVRAGSSFVHSFILFFPFFLLSFSGAFGLVIHGFGVGVFSFIFSGDQILQSFFS